MAGISPASFDAPPDRLEDPQWRFTRDLTTKNKGIESAANFASLERPRPLWLPVTPLSADVLLGCSTPLLRPQEHRSHFVHAKRLSVQVNYCVAIRADWS